MQRPLPRQVHAHITFQTLLNFNFLQGLKTNAEFKIPLANYSPEKLKVLTRMKYVWKFEV